MRAKPSFAMFAGLMLASVGLGLLVFLFAGVPMIVTRRLYGWRKFLFANLGAAVLMCGVGLVPFGILYVVLTLLVAVFYEARLAHLGIARAGLIALASGFSFSLAAAGIFLKVRGVSEIVALKAQMKDFTQKLVEVSPQMHLDPEMLWGQIPAVLILTFLAALTVALVMEGRLLERLGFPFLVQQDRPEDQLKNFRVPEALVWVAIIAVLAAFLEVGQPVVKLVGLNVFYVLVFFYFLQGIAIVTTYFEVFKVGAMWRSLWYFLMIIQLLVVVAAIGFSDYWLDYREKIIKKAAELKKGI